jgi:predicted CXXCH cytochrome family protein
MQERINKGKRRREDDIPEDRIGTSMKCVGVVVLLCLALASVCLGAQLSIVNPTHTDRSKNPFGCAGCHKGHGKIGTAMLDSSKNEICFSCHGFSVTPGKIGSKEDLETVFRKRYRHPVVETSQYHRPAEQLPERNPSVPRHVACQDCHMVHVSTQGNPLAGVQGYARGAVRDLEPGKEYMLCYKCHSDSANLPSTSTNKTLEFDTGNASYHPVEGRGKNPSVPSLINPLNAGSTITCTDCHGNDDKYGPKGPHGSNYEFILKAQYLQTESAESANAYDLCYSCHDRQSILGNVSFQKHKEHIVYNRVPCAACHSPHGSRRNPHLIEFDTTFVGIGRLPNYAPSPDGRPVCLLRCHIGGRDVVHDNSFYQTRRWP